MECDDDVWKRLHNQGEEAPFGGLVYQLLAGKNSENMTLIHQVMF